MTDGVAMNDFREAWLKSCAEKMNAALFGGRMPPYRVTCGWPSRGALGKKNKTIGQCFYPSASGDSKNELIVSMYLDDPMEVAATLAHEMIHAIVGHDAGHKGPFRHLALDIGLEGKMTATRAGETFKRSLQPILEDLGPYPHAKLEGAAMNRRILRRARNQLTSTGWAIVAAFLLAAALTALRLGMGGL